MRIILAVTLLILLISTVTCGRYTPTDNCIIWGEGCPPEQAGPTGQDGSPGKDGINGVDGKDGRDGTNGQDGANGKDGISPVLPSSSVVAVIDPCGDSPGRVDEVILRLADNSLLSLFADSSSGTNPRLGILTPGTYQTTDGSGCRFTVDSQLSIVNEHH